jgi:hypothetical protein
MNRHRGTEHVHSRAAAAGDASAQAMLGKGVPQHRILGFHFFQLVTKFCHGMSENYINKT